MGRTAQNSTEKERLSRSIYHFTMAYDSTVPNTFVYTYYSVGNATAMDDGVNGANAAVGLQGRKFSRPPPAPHLTFFPAKTVLLTMLLLQCSPTAKPRQPPTLSAPRRSSRGCACRAAGRRIAVWWCRELIYLLTLSRRVCEEEGGWDGTVFLNDPAVYRSICHSFLGCLVCQTVPR
jgi:hypothetical protein